MSRLGERVSSFRLAELEAGYYITSILQYERYGNYNCVTLSLFSYFLTETLEVL